MRLRLLVLSSTVIALSLAVVAATFGQDYWRASDDTVETILAKLAIKPRTVETVSEMAARTRRAVEKGDFATAQSIVAGVIAKSRLEYWRYYPFDEFIEAIGHDKALEPQFDKWVVQSPQEAIPRLMRAQFEQEIGWAARGSDYADKVPAADMKAFLASIRKGVADVDASIAANDAIPYSYYLKLRLLQGFGYGPKLQAAFDAAIAKFPGYYRPYALLLVTLDPRWGGSVPAMYAFTDRYAGNAPQFSPLKVLYLTLYRDLLNLSAAVCEPYEHDKGRMSQCVAAAMQKAARPSLQDRLAEAFALYDHTDKFQFAEFLRPLLSQMRWTKGSDPYSAVMLQMAANAMHSNTELKDGGPGHNDYVIDEEVANTWYGKGFYDNSITKYQEALDDIDRAGFEHPQDKIAALDRLYQDMVGAFNKLNRYPEAIAYEKAAVAVSGDREFDYVACYGYYKLKEYRRALAECGEEISANPTNAVAHYWRGETYQAMGDIDSAVKDLTEVAESQQSLRTTAAINLSVIYGDRKDFKGALDILNKYTYLYDPKTTSRMDMAISYNNRCYQYMQLGELKKALEDCSSSLKYGTIPDAVRKQQELLKSLRAQGEL